MSENQNIRVAVDAIAFGYQNNQLCVLLIQKKFGSQEF
jgi:8-oxo-dGTP diphosphatase